METEVLSTVLYRDPDSGALGCGGQVASQQKLGAGQQIRSDGDGSSVRVNSLCVFEVF
jgi:hypothetical protein